MTMTIMIHHVSGNIFDASTETLLRLLLPQCCHGNDIFPFPSLYLRLCDKPVNQSVYSLERCNCLSQS